MSDIDDLVRQAVDGVTRIASLASRFATRVLVGVTVICVGGFLLGVAALSGGIETVWIVLAFVFGAIAIGSAFLARWRVGAVRRHVPELADEVRSLISSGTGTGRTVVETFVVDTEGADDQGDLSGTSAIVLSRQMSGFRNVSGSGAGSTERLTAATAALTTFPLLLFMAIAITMVFSFLGLIFLLALAL